MDNKEQNLPTPPAPPSAFTKFTSRVVTSLIVAAIRGLFIYIIWNFCLAQELHLQTFSYLFCCAVFLFLQTAFYSPTLEKMSFLISSMEQLTFELKNIAIFNVTREIIKEPEVIVEKEETSNKDA